MPIPALKDGSSGSESETEDSDGDGKKGEVVKSKPKSKTVKSKAKVRKEPKYIDLEHFPLDLPEESAASVSKRRQTKKPPKQKGNDDVVYVKLKESALKLPPRPMAKSEPVIGARGNACLVTTGLVHVCHCNGIYVIHTCRCTST